MPGQPLRKLKLKHCASRKKPTQPSHPHSGQVTIPCFAYTRVATIRLDQDQESVLGLQCIQAPLPGVPVGAADGTK
jgi:hypothetical protein